MHWAVTFANSEDLEDGLPDAADVACGISSITLSLTTGMSGSFSKLSRRRASAAYHTCQYPASDNSAISLCEAQFVRLEHLIRHEKTVHEKDRHLIYCMVRSCKKSFARRDNLRTHYLTHLRREGRGGRNEKMSLVELEALLRGQDDEVLLQLKQRIRHLRYFGAIPQYF